MSNAETLYAIRTAYPDYLERARTQTASLPIYLDGELAAPTAGTFTLFDQSTTVLDSGAVIITDDVATYEIVAAILPSTLSLGHGYREEWVLLLPDGTTRTYPRDAAVVRSAPYPVVTDADLLAVYSDLTRQLAEGVTGWAVQREEAWKRVIGKLESAGIFPDHIANAWSLRRYHLELTLEIVCTDYHRRAGGRWLELAEQHARQASFAWRELRFIRAAGDDGVAEQDKIRAADTGVTHINRPGSTGWGSWGGLG